MSKLPGVGRGGRPTDYSGQRFGRLVALSILPAIAGQKRHWLFRCDCGAEKEAAVGLVTRGHIKSCGCYRRDFVRGHRLKHGQAATGAETPEYRAWINMRGRCQNPSDDAYRHYGGRGISVCERWNASFEDFMADMGPKASPNLTIERADVDGNYEPRNCFWATRTEQANNKRNNRRIEVQGRSLTIAQAARLFGVRSDTLRGKLNRGVSVEQALGLAP